MFQTVIYKNNQIHYRSQGSGNTLVLLHGFMESITIWEEFINEFSKTHRIIAIDLPGHGFTDVWETTHSMEFMAQCVKMVLDELNILKCAILGHSMGGYVALSFASQFPDFLTGLCLFHSTAEADTEIKKHNRLKSIAAVKLNRLGYIKQSIPMLFAPKNRDKMKTEIEKCITIAEQTSTEGIVAALSGMGKRPSYTNLLKTLNIPYLFVLGKDDPIIPMDQITNQIALPEQQLTITIEDAGHMSMIEAESQTIELLNYCFTGFFAI